MTVAFRPFLAATLSAATILAGCAAGSSTASVQPRLDASAPAASTSAAVPALATDQACTARAAAGSTLASVPYRPDDIAAMTLPRSTLGTAVSHYEIDSLRYGYQDNVESAQRGILIVPKGLCTLNRTSGRIVGFARAFTGPIQTIITQAHVFFTAAGAGAWVKGFVAGMKATPGTQGVRKVTVSSVPALGSGATRVETRCTGGCTWTWVLFQRGSLVGLVVNGRDAGTSPVLNLTTTAQKLSQRMAGRVATVKKRAVPDPADAVMALSAGLPKAALGSKYAGLVWDWFYGGCWDAREIQLSTGDNHALTDASKYGFLWFCRAMYVPPRGKTTVSGVERVYTGGRLYSSASGAHGQFAVNVQRDAANRNSVRFAVPALGEEAAGFQTRGTSTTTRIYFRMGRYLATVTLVTRGISGMVGEVKRWAPMLQARVGALQSTHTF